MRIDSSVTSVSWIPSEAMTGPMRVPMDIGVGHYDPPPPDHIDEATLDALRDNDGLRCANRLEAWIEVEEDDIVGAGYSGRGIIGSTTARLGVGSVTFPGVAYPLIQEEPVIERGAARFVQTAGGRTGAPFPHRIDHVPYVRISGPTAWTTLALEIAADGSSSYEVVGASPFPRHWIYDETGRLAAKSGVIDFTEWTKVHDHEHSPWHGVQREALVAAADTTAERALSRDLMAAGAKIRKLKPDDVLTRQGEPGDRLYLILDGVLQVDVDGDVLTEIGPGAIVGERAILERGVRTSTVRALTPTRVAVVAANAVDTDSLTDVAAGHRREEPERR